MKSKVFVCTDENRDKGKRFYIEEMSAFKAEKWAQRAFLALARSGLDLPDDMTVLSAAGFRGLVAVGLAAFTKGGIQFGDIEPLLDEMIGCVQAMPDRARADVRRPLVDSDIEEVSTLVRLRIEVFNLHAGFSEAAPSPGSTSAAAPAKPSSSTRTSRRSSARS